MNQSELKDKVTLKYIGTCPVCGKGRMLQGSAGWTCNHFKDWQDKCEFTIFGMYSGHTVTEEEAVKLITEGKTEEMDLFTKEGKKYRGILTVQDGKVKVRGVRRYLDTRCPVCGGKVWETGGGWVCEGAAAGRCSMFIPAVVCSRHTQPEDVRQLLSEGRTESRSPHAWCWRRTAPAGWTAGYAGVPSAEATCTQA